MVYRLCRLVNQKIDGIRLRGTPIKAVKIVRPYFLLVTFHVMLGIYQSLKTSWCGVSRVEWEEGAQWPTLHPYIV